MTGGAALSAEFGDVDKCLQELVYPSFHPILMPVVLPMTSSTYFTGIIDSGASGTYFVPNAPVTDLDHCAPTVRVGTTTSQLLTSSASGALDQPSLPPAARDGHVMPSFKHTLISIGKLCNAGCVITFTQSNKTMFDMAGCTVLQGWCEEQGARLWHFNLHNDTHPGPLSGTNTHHQAILPILVRPSSAAAKRLKPAMAHYPP